MRALAAILAYLMVAVAGLATGYYATAPASAARGAAVPARSERHQAHTGRGHPAELEAVAEFLAAEERREETARRTSAGL